MKLYSFTNMYLSEKQAGIQTAHLVNQFWKKYGHTNSEQSVTFWDWSILDETIILLNGGNHAQLNAALELISGSGYPYDVFWENKEALNDAMTAVGVILPENFNTREDRDERIRQGMYNGTTNISAYKDAELAELLNISRLV